MIRRKGIRFPGFSPGESGGLANLLRSDPGKLLAGLAVILLLRLVYLEVCGLDLIADESYYWDWSRRLDWCYYSKPPMVAWLNALSTGLLGVSERSVRLPAVILGTGLLVPLYCLTNRFYGTRAARLAVLLMLASPAQVALSLLMTIDVPFLFFWTLSLALLARALGDPKGSLVWWAGAGWANGLALLSKQTAVALPVMTGLAVILCPDLRRHLFRGFLLYFSVFLLGFLPILFWNIQHDWITFQHTSHHFERKPWNPLEAVGDGLGFLGAQWGVLSPVTWVLVVILSGVGLLHFRRLGSRERFLFLTGPLPLLGVMGLSFYQKVLPNWPAPFYFSGIVLLAGWLTGSAPLPRSPHPFSSWIRPALIAGFALALLAYLLPPLMPVLHLEGSKFDPTARLRRWEDLAVQVQSFRQRVPRPGNTFLLVAGHRHLVSALAFYLPDHPTVFRWEERGVVLSQYEIWPGPIDRIGQDALIFSQKLPGEIPAALAAVFQHFTFWEEIDLPIGPAFRHHYYIYLGQGLRAWPPEKGPEASPKRVSEKAIKGEGLKFPRYQAGRNPGKTGWFSPPVHFSGLLSAGGSPGPSVPALFFRRPLRL